MMQMLEHGRSGFCLRRFSQIVKVAAVCCNLVAASATPGAASEALRIGYSDWPGWVAWQIAVDKGWIHEAGVDAEFVWSDYSASMDAFTAGRLDADMVTNGDALVMGGAGAKNTIIMVTDYSNGNDVIVAKSDIRSVSDLKGKKIGVEIGLVENLLLVNALRRSGLSEKDLILVGGKTNDMPALLASGSVDAIGAWQPIAGRAISDNAGARPIYTSAEQPGLIYDVIAVAPKSLADRQDDWLKILKIWDRIVRYIGDPSTRPDALGIMAKRVGLPVDVYARMLDGTRLLSLSDGRKAFLKRPGFGSLYGSTQNANAFNLKYGAYKESQVAEDYIDPSLTVRALKSAD